MGNLSKDLICQRPWLCLYEAMNRSWFGQLEEAKALLDEAEKRIRTKDSSPDTRSMLGYHAYVKSRVIAMQGDTPRAIEYCLTARENVPADNLELQIDFSITLGYEYFLNGDFFNANKILNETIQLGSIARAINNPVAAYCLLARSQIYQGRLHEANDLLHKAEQLIHQGSSQYLGVVGLLEVERAALWCEQNEVDTALAGIKQGLDHLPWWGKADDFCLAYITLARIHLALGDRIEAAGVIKEAAQLVMSCGVFSEARCAVEAAQVKMWLVQGDWPSVDRWAAEFGKRFDSPDPFRFEDELTHITQARVLMAQNKPDEAIRLLTCLEESARLGGRQGRLIEILNLKALAFQATGDVAQANLNLTESMVLAEPEEYVRIFLDEGQFMQYLLNQWLSHIESHPVRNYATHLLLQLENELPIHKSAQEKISMTSDLSASTGQDLIEPISPREREVLEIMALGRTNQEIAQQLTISPGTVKAHAASIYRKLDVANRTEAVARARQLGILS